VAYRVGDLLDTLLGLSSARIRVATDPARLRPSDIPVVLGSPARMTAETGWTALIPIEQTLADLLDYWRQRVAVTRA
jgi:GDP-4-dehydro-6-deoxy-D-mannose reductase